MLAKPCFNNYVAFRTLTTPTEETWPGVSNLPDYKPTFPCWKTNQLHTAVKQLDNVGLDLLQVHAHTHTANFIERHVQNECKHGCMCLFIYIFCEFFVCHSGWIGDFLVLLINPFFAWSFHSQLSMICSAGYSIKNSQFYHKFINHGNW